MGNTNGKKLQEAPPAPGGDGIKSNPRRRSSLISVGVMDITGKEIEAPRRLSIGNVRKKKNASTWLGSRLANIYAATSKTKEDYVFPKFDKSAADKDFIYQSIKDHFMFDVIGNEDRKRLLNAFQSHSVSKGKAVIKQGDIGDYFYIIQSGRIEFIVNGKKVGVANRGNNFGEIALLYDCKRAATCIAAEPCLFWRVDQKTYRQILAHGRQTSEEDTIKTLKKVSFLKDLPLEILSKMAVSATERSFKRGDVIHKRGSPGTKFHIIKKGTVKLNEIKLGDQIFNDRILKSGDFFGERAILKAEPHTANAIAQDEVSTLYLSRKEFLTIIGPLEDLVKQTSDLKLVRYIAGFGQREISDYECSELVTHINDEVFTAGTTLYSEGEEWEPTIYFVRSGKVKLTSKCKSYSSEFVAGGFFGAHSVFRHRLPLATALVVEDALLGKLTRVDISTIVLGAEFTIDSSGSLSEDSHPTTSIRINELERECLIGVGVFGEVWLASHNTKGVTKAYAMKVQKKRLLVDKIQVINLAREIEVMSSLDHPFLLKLFNVYMDTSTVTMLLDFVQGGELRSRMKANKNKILSKDESKFYAGSILEGLRYMHYHNIVHRDLKPENILIDKDGYAVLIDFGFAVKIEGKTYTLCGTPWYIAPEVILGMGYNKSADYWSWAILVFEMCVGRTPFHMHGQSQILLFNAIAKANYKMSRKAEKSLQDLIGKILVTTPQTRIGNLAGGAHDIKSHEWFKGTNFVELSKKALAAPWKPELEDSMDYTHFNGWDHSKLKRGYNESLTAEEQSEFDFINDVW